MILTFSLFACSMCAPIQEGEIAFCPDTEPGITHRELQVDNERVRVWKTTIYSSNPLKMHRHEIPRVLVALQGGTLKRITDKGEISELVFETGKAYWLDADPEGELHADVNESDRPIVVMIVESKQSLRE